MERRINILKTLDWVTIGIFLIMVLFGWTNIYASVFNEEHASIFDMSQRYGKQLFWIIAALMLAVFVIVVDSRFYLFFSYTLYALVIASLMLVLLVGKEVNGAKSWFEIASFSLQPSEFAKFATVLALARFLSAKSRNPESIRILLQSLAIVFAPAVLIAIQPDLGSVLIYVALILVLFREGMSLYLFVAGMFAVALFLITLLVESYIIFLVLIFLVIIIYAFVYRDFPRLIKAVLTALFVGLAVFIAYRWVFDMINMANILLVTVIISGISYAYYIYRFKEYSLLKIYVFLVGAMLFVFSVDYTFSNILQAHQQSRINLVLGIESDPFGQGYNLNQSKISIGSGGFTGKGFLQGTQTKFKFVPEQTTDFIFCTVGEEWGFVGSTFVIALFMFLFLRLIYLAERQRSAFSRVYGYGVVSILFIHFIINIGMTIGLVPIIGIPLPFFSYGGSSLWGFTILLFIFLRLDASRNAYLI